MFAFTVILYFWFPFVGTFSHVSLVDPQKVSDKPQKLDNSGSSVDSLSQVRQLQKCLYFSFNSALWCDVNLL